MACHGQKHNPLAKKKSPKAQMVMVSKSPPVFLVLLTYQP